jgi:outer membrane protein TolC
MPTGFRCFRGLVLLALASPLGAQAPLSLREAFHRADALGYGNRVAGAAASAAEARAGATLRGVLPTIRAEAGWVRSTDPLATFGFLMRQRQVTPQAFDPASLNFPVARSDVGTGLVLEAPLVNIDAWAGRAAAGHAAAAANASAEWVATGARLDVVRAYFGAVLATEQVATLEAANRAALAHVHQAESAVTNGVVTRSDALLAAVKQGEVETQLVAARGNASLARLQLALLLGTPNDTAFVLPTAVPHPVIEEVDTSRSAARADVRMADAGVAAARAARLAADAALLPRINGFARYDWHDPRSLAGGQSMWTVGVMASWSPFSGGAELAMRRASAADVQAARAGSEAVHAGAMLDVQSAEIAVTVATRALAIASNAVAQATEAHRIVGRKYDGGLAAVTELLDAQAAELGSRLAEAKARYDLLVARAALVRARGTDLTTIAAALDAADGIRE